MSFKQKALKGLKWTTLSSVIDSVVKLLQVSILTRFLTKEDFGTIAIAILFISFTSIFLDMGLSTAIMHKQNISKKHYSSLFWLNIISGIILTVILVAIAPLIANYYNDDSLTPIVQLLSLNVFFSSIGRQSRTIRHKQLDFKFMSNVENVTSILTLIIAVLLAFKGFGVYSLVYSTMFNITFSNVVYLFYGVKKDKNISSHFKLSETYEYLKIGVYQLGSAILDFFGREIDIVIISTTFGKEILGAYSLCKRIVQMLYGVITPIMIKVATPLFAQLQSSRKELTSKFIKIIELVSIANFPVFTLVALMSPIILKVVYGESYVEYHLILTFLAGYYGLLSVAGTVSSAQIALGRTDIGLYWTIFRIISSGLFVYIGSLYSPTIMACILFIGAIVNTVPFWMIQVKPMLQISLFKYVKPQIVPFLLSIFAYLILFKFTSNNSLFKMLFLGVFFVLIYGVGMYFLKGKYLIDTFLKKKI